MGHARVKQAQAALKFGADDFDGTVIEEKIGHEAGATSDQGLTRKELTDMIGAAAAPQWNETAFQRGVTPPAAGGRGKGEGKPFERAFPSPSPGSPSPFPSETFYRRFAGVGERKE